MGEVSEVERYGLNNDFGHRQIVVFGYSGEFFVELRRNFECPSNSGSPLFLPFQ